MKHFALIWSGLRRKPLRTLLTILSVAVAFVLYGLLDGLTASFDEAVDRFTEDTRLRTQSRMNITTPLPLAHLPIIEDVPGVTGVAFTVFFGGYFREPSDSITTMAMDVDRLAGIYPKLILPEAQREAMLRTRTGALIGVDLVEEKGWSVGDRIPLKSSIWSRGDGSSDWFFDIVGVYRFPDDAFPANREVWINYDYFDEAREFANGTVSMFFIDVADADRAATVAEEIDRRFMNSAGETRTRSEQDFIRTQINQVGNIGFIVDAIVSAVIFTLIFLIGNTMTQSFRERIREFAILRTYGFGDAAIAALVFAEALVICLSGAALGLGVAATLFPRIFYAIVNAALPIEWSVVVAGVPIAILLAASSTLSPLLRLRRLEIATALARR